MMEDTVYPPPIFKPIFKLAANDWDSIQDELSINIDIPTKLFIIYYCNNYIIRICKFYENNNKARALSRAIKKFNLAEPLISLLGEMFRLRQNGNDRATPSTDEGIQNGIRFIRNFTMSYSIEADSILKDKDAAEYGLPPDGYEARTARRAYRDYVNFDEEFLHVKSYLDSIRRHIEEKSKEIGVWIGFHGDPYIDELTIIMWISFKKSGGIGKYTENSVRFIDFIFGKMREYCFCYFNPNVSASISTATYSSQADAVKNRLKRATTNLAPDVIEALDNVSLFASHPVTGPENLSAGLFRVSLIELI